MRRIKISALHREGAKLLAERARRIPGEVGYYEESYLLYIYRGSLYIDYRKDAPWQVGGNSGEDRLARKVGFGEAVRLLTSPEEWGGRGNSSSMRSTPTPGGNTAPLGRAVRPSSRP